MGWNIVLTRYANDCWEDKLADTMCSYQYSKVFEQCFNVNDFNRLHGVVNKEKRQKLIQGIDKFIENNNYNLDLKGGIKLAMVDSNSYDNLCKDFLKIQFILKQNKKCYLSIG